MLENLRTLEKEHDIWTLPHLVKVQESSSAVSMLTCSLRGSGTAGDLFSCSYPLFTLQPGFGVCVLRGSQFIFRHCFQKFKTALNN